MNGRAFTKSEFARKSCLDSDRCDVTKVKSSLLGYATQNKFCAKQQC